MENGTWDGARALMEGTGWDIISAEGLYQDLGTGGCGERSLWALEGGRALREGGASTPQAFCLGLELAPSLGFTFFLGPKEVRSTNHSRKTGLGTFSFLVYLKRTLVLLSIS